MDASSWNGSGLSFVLFEMGFAHAFVVVLVVCGEEEHIVSSQYHSPGQQQASKQRQASTRHGIVSFYGAVVPSKLPWACFSHVATLHSRGLAP